MAAQAAANPGERLAAFFVTSAHPPAGDPHRLDGFLFDLVDCLIHDRLGLSFAADQFVQLSGDLAMPLQSLFDRAPVTGEEIEHVLIVLAIAENLGDVGQGHIPFPQLGDDAGGFRLARIVVAIAGFIVDGARDQQSLLVIEAQGLDRQPDDFRELANG